MLDRITLFTIVGGLLLLLAAFFLIVGQRQNRMFAHAYRRIGTRDLFTEDVMAAARSNSRLLVAALLLGAAVAGIMAFESRINTLPDRPGDTALSTQDTEKLQADLANAQTLVSQLTAENETLRAAGAMAGEANAAQVDALKQEYEKAFINFYYLQRCNQATVYDALILQAALIQELSQAGGGAALAEQIPATAMSTYQTLYAQGTCDAAAIQPIAETRRAYNEAVLRNLALRFSLPAAPRAAGTEAPPQPAAVAVTPPVEPVTPAEPAVTETPAAGAGPGETLIAPGDTIIQP